ncbi:MAG: CvpA family protein [bacterium]|nr:CvpA family protein [bacterium]
MNWIDGVLVVLLLASVVVGSKKGLIRELMAFVVFFTSVVLAVNYIDNFAVWVYNQLGGSPLISAILAFVILLAGSYAAFKVAGMLFYKAANIKQTGKRDQMGGALVGFLRGWVAVGFLTFLVFLLPMPNSFYTSFEASFFGPAMAKTIPLMYEGTTPLHPQSPNFINKIEKTLLVGPSNSSSGIVSEERAQVYEVLYRLEKYFSVGVGQS